MALYQSRLVMHFLLPLQLSINTSLEFYLHLFPISSALSFQMTNSLALATS
jgi:hypothetical protein